MNSETLDNIENLFILFNKNLKEFEGDIKFLQKIIQNELIKI